MRTTEGAAPPAERTFAWGGALLFFGSLSFFLFSYAVTFGENSGHPAEAGTYAGRDGGTYRAIAMNVALFTVFALHHSVFARERVRAWVARHVPPRLERACYVWVASLMLIAVCLLWQPVPGVAWAATGAWRWVALAAQGAGLWLTLRGASIINIFELAGVRQLTAAEGPVEFKTIGPYGWVRHPIYTGWFLLVFAAPTMTMTRLVFAIVSSVYLLVAIPLEERSLRRSSGDAYDLYARQVRWKLVPWVY